MTNGDQKGDVARQEWMVRRERGCRIPADWRAGTGTTGEPVALPSVWCRNRSPVGPGRASSGRRRVRFGDDMAVAGVAEGRGK